MKPFTSIFLPLCVVCIGLLTCAGFLFGSEPLIRLGFASAASPMPLPFYDFNGKQEMFAYRIVFRAVDVHGAVFEETMTMSDLVGPHRKKIVTVAALSHMHLQPSTSYSVLEYAVCHSPETVFSDMPEIDISSAEIEIFSYHVPSTLVRSVTITC